MQLHTLETPAGLLGVPVVSLLSTRRPPASLVRWKGEAAVLVELIRELGEEDVRALVWAAKRMSAKR